MARRRERDEDELSAPPLSNAIFAGEEAAATLAEQGITGPQQAIALARQLKAKGASRAQIHKATSALLEGTPYAGVSFGQNDGKPRFEISDHDARFKPEGMPVLSKARIGDVLDHPELYKAVPSVGLTRIERSTTRESGMIGGDISIGKQHVTRSGGRQTFEPSAMGPALHEIQHDVQGKHRLNPGGSPDDFPGLPREMQIELYRSIDGEQEAEMTRKRQSMTPAERRANPPKPDVPWADQIDVERELADARRQRFIGDLADVATDAWKRLTTREVVEGRPIHQRRLDPRKVSADPAAFQFKSGGDASGVTDRLKGVKEWDALAAGKQIVYERANGERVIADGHQRRGLALRAIEAGQKGVMLDAYVLREKDGWSTRDVRAYAALKNMKESSGNPLDMAKVMRERPDLAAKSLPMSDAKIRDAVALSKLSPAAFDLVESGVVKAEHAAPVGAQVKDTGRHADLLTEMAKAGMRSAEHARLYVSQAMAAPSISETTGSLFGDETKVRSLLAERAKVLDRALGALKSDKRIFAMLEREAANIETAGNRLAHASNLERADTAGRLAELVERLSTTRGPVSEMLDRAAMTMAEGKTPAQAARGFGTDVSKTMKGGGINALTGGDAAPMVHSPDPNQSDIFTDPGKNSGWSAEAREASAKTRKGKAKGRKQLLIEGWHGSGSDFDAFDFSKAGTGQGENSRGPGAYIAGGKDLGESYKRLAQHGGKQGRLYKVQYDADLHEMLDWEKPISQQSEHVRNALSKAVAREALRPNQGIVSRFVETLMPSTEPVGKFITERMNAGDDHFLRQGLLKAGIKGVKYRDGNARQAGEPDYSFVAFDDKKLKIVEKDGKPVARNQMMIEDDGGKAAPHGDLMAEIAEMKRARTYAESAIKDAMAQPNTRLSVKRGDLTTVLTRDPNGNGFRVTTLRGNEPFGHRDYPLKDGDMRWLVDDMMSGGLKPPRTQMMIEDGSPKPSKDIVPSKRFGLTDAGRSITYSDGWKDAKRGLAPAKADADYMAGFKQYASDKSPRAAERAMVEHMAKSGDAWVLGDNKITLAGKTMPENSKPKGQTSFLPDATTKEQLAAAAKAKGRPSAGQQGMDDGLFGSGMNQTDLVEMAKQSLPSPKQIGMQPSKYADNSFKARVGNQEFTAYVEMEGNHGWKVKTVSEHSIDPKYGAARFDRRHDVNGYYPSAQSAADAALDQVSQPSKQAPKAPEGLTADSRYKYVGESRTLERGPVAVYMDKTSGVHVVADKNGAFDTSGNPLGARQAPSGIEMAAAASNPEARFHASASKITDHVEFRPAKQPIMDSDGNKWVNKPGTDAWSVDHSAALTQTENTGKPAGWSDSAREASATARTSNPMSASSRAAELEKAAAAKDWDTWNRVKAEIARSQGNEVGAQEMERRLALPKKSTSKPVIEKGMLIDKKTQAAISKRSLALGRKIGDNPTSAHQDMGTVKLPDGTTRRVWQAHAVDAVVLDTAGNTVVIERGGHGPGKGMKATPGGFMDPSKGGGVESAKAAVLRELAEEAGVKGKVLEGAEVTPVGKRKYGRSFDIREAANDIPNSPIKKGDLFTVSTQGFKIKTTGELPASAVKAGDDARRAGVMPLKDLKAGEFGIQDHYPMIQAAAKGMPKQVSAADFDFSKAPQFRKTATLRADQIAIAKGGEEVTTRQPDGKGGSFVETKNTAKAGDRIITRSPGDSYIVGGEKFGKLYEPDPSKPGMFRSANSGRAIRVKQDVQIKAPWGEVQTIKKGGVVFKSDIDGGVYGNQKETFDADFARQTKGAKASAPKATASDPFAVNLTLTAQRDGRFAIQDALDKLSPKDVRAAAKAQGIYISASTPDADVKMATVKAAFTKVAERIAAAGGDASKYRNQVQEIERNMRTASMLPKAENILPPHEKSTKASRATVKQEIAHLDSRIDNARASLSIGRPTAEDIARTDKLIADLEQQKSGLRGTQNAANREAIIKNRKANAKGKPGAAAQPNAELAARKEKVRKGTKVSGEATLAALKGGTSSIAREIASLSESGDMAKADSLRAQVEKMGQAELRALVKERNGRAPAKSANKRKLLSSVLGDIANGAEAKSKRASIDKLTKWPEGKPRNQSFIEPTPAAPAKAAPASAPVSAKPTTLARAGHAFNVAGTAGLGVGIAAAAVIAANESAKAGESGGKQAAAAATAATVAAAPAAVVGGGMYAAAKWGGKTAAKAVPIVGWGIAAAAAAHGAYTEGRKASAEGKGAGGIAKAAGWGAVNSVVPIDAAVEAARGVRGRLSSGQAKQFREANAAFQRDQQMHTTQTDHSDRKPGWSPEARIAAAKAKGAALPYGGDPSKAPGYTPPKTYNGKLA